MALLLSVMKDIPDCSQRGGNHHGTSVVCDEGYPIEGGCSQSPHLLKGKRQIQPRSQSLCGYLSHSPFVNETMSGPEWGQNPLDTCRPTCPQPGGKEGFSDVFRIASEGGSMTVVDRFLDSPT
ncbi:hypothetical protein I79_021123 [Cricetulus griseus]|uniref:Uncharacterized protein n=1 Tax=Cricetulus griseus TaxID=10029 RepID=G3IBU0_CRIGR|nr:hypothetical protein I79_021123 [Cricetulus griseus]